MSKDTGDQNVFGKFIREDAPEVAGIFNPDSEERNHQHTISYGDPQPPTLPRVKPAKSDERDAFWKSLRAFFRNEQAGELPIKDGLPLLFPALLSRYRKLAYEPNEYPFSTQKNKVSFSDQAVFQLLVAAIQAHHEQYRRQLKEELAVLSRKIGEMLSMEEGNNTDEPGQLNLSFGVAGNYIDFEQLSSVIPAHQRASGIESRVSRLRKVKQSLEKAESALFEYPAMILIEASMYESGAIDWEKVFTGCRIQSIREEEMCEETTRVFDQLMQEMSSLFAARRMANLEIATRYRPDIHDRYFNKFDWRDFSDEEIAMSPPVLMLTEVGALMRSQLTELSYLLASARPVKVVAIKPDARINHRRKQKQQLYFAQELGSLAIAHRHTYVLQSTAVSPGHLYQGFVEGLSRNLPGIFHILNHPSNGEGVEDAYLWASAAVESRDFPVFRYDRSKGEKWGARFDIESNPEPEKNWPVLNLDIMEAGEIKDSLTLAFTFADFAAQDTAYTGHFKVVPPEFWSDELIPVSDYLTLPKEEEYGKVPFIWMVDPQNTLVKIAVSWTIVLLCQERLENWHYLQESAGLNNYHVEKAIGKLSRELTDQFNKQKAQLIAQHKEALKQARDQASTEVISRLADALLGLSPMDTVIEKMLISSQKVEAIRKPPAKTEAKAEKEKAPPPSPQPKAKPKPQVVKAEEEQEDEFPLGEAWIETPLCTTCNECTNINSQVFTYNEEKQAFIADPKAGTFAEIVAAAELCPAGIIHPGAPQNDKEPGLEALIERAKPFNA